MRTHIVVAVDGGGDTAGALRIANQLNETRGRGVVVVAVLEPVGVHGAAYSDAMTWLGDDLSSGQAERLRDAIADRARAVGAERLADGVRVEIGPAARTIVRAAQETGAELIILGHAEDAALERWFGPAITLEVVQLAHLPVLVVPPRVRYLPGRAVVAVDFTPFSLDAALAVRSVLAPDPELHLAHVLAEAADRDSAPGTLLGGSPTPSDRRSAAQDRLAAVADRVAAAGPGRVVTHVLHGDPFAEMVSLAARVDAGLIATGSHGHGFWGRLVHGSVSSRLLRSAACAVFVVPPRQARTESIPPAPGGSTAR